MTKRALQGDISIEPEWGAVFRANFSSQDFFRLRTRQCFETRLLEVANTLDLLNASTAVSDYHIVLESNGGRLPKLEWSGRIDGRTPFPRLCIVACKVVRENRMLYTNQDSSKSRRILLLVLLLQAYASVRPSRKVQGAQVSSIVVSPSLRVVKISKPLILGILPGVPILIVTCPVAPTVRRITHVLNSDLPKL